MYIYVYIWKYFSNKRFIVRWSFKSTRATCNCLERYSQLSKLSLKPLKLQ